jgi:glycosyltransferase involved in cell wall biosynthesis
MSDASSLRILHVLASFQVGGAEQVALTLARLQTRQGHHVHVVGLAPPPDGPHARNFEQAGVRVHRIAKMGPSIDPSLVLRLAWRFRREKIDVVHTHNRQPLIYAGPAARLAGTAHVHTKHGRGDGTSREMLLRRAAAYTADRFVAVSEQTRQEAITRKEAPPGRLETIPNGIELDGFRPDPEARTAVRSELGIPASAFVVGTVGRLAAVKNQTLLIRAVEPMLGPDFRLIFVGDGESRADLEACARETDRGQWIHFLGRRSDTGRVLNAFDVFALSSHSEGLPLAIPEAMAVGLPIVSTAVGGIPSVVQDSQTGILVPPGDASALRASLSALASDSERARRMGAAARTQALECYSAQRMVLAYQQCYMDILALRGRPTSTTTRG